MTPHDKSAAAARRHRRGRGRPGHRGMLLAAAGAAALALAIAVVIVAGPGRGTGRMTGSDQLTSGGPAAAPLTVLYAQAAGWNGGQVRPAAVYLGEGGAPLVKDAAWSRWTRSGARGTGRLWLQKPGCTSPSYQCPYQRFPVTITLSGARAHGRVRYFSRMVWSYPQNLVQHVISWRFRSGLWQEA